MGKRGDRRRLRQVEMKESKAINGPRKYAERARRRTKLLGMLQANKGANTRVLRNFVAVELGKPEAEIKPDDVTKLLSVAGKK
jgi:hypothetical protein